jgi:hypothetical protein
MSASSGFMQQLINALRSGGGQDAAGNKRGPLEAQLDGYRQHVKEATAMGETPLSYAEWIKQQPALGAPQQ